MSTQTKQHNILTVAAATEAAVGGNGPMEVTITPEHFTSKSYYPAIVLFGVAGAETPGLYLYIEDEDDWVEVSDVAGDAFTFTATQHVASVRLPGTYGISKAASTSADYTAYIQY